MSGGENGGGRGGRAQRPASSSGSSGSSRKGNDGSSEVPLQYMVNPFAFGDKNNHSNNAPFLKQSKAQLKLHLLPLKITILVKYYF